MTPMTDWPRDDAPVSEWLRPVSGKLRNLREPLSCSTVEKQEGTSERTQRRHRARRKIRDSADEID